MPFYVDDPFEFAADASPEVQEQLRAAFGDPVGTAFQDPGSGGGMGWEDFAQRAFSRINPNADFGTNAWNVGIGAVADSGLFDSDLLRSINPNASSTSNIWNAGKWLMDNQDIFGAVDKAEEQVSGAIGDVVTLFTQNGDPINIDAGILAAGSFDEKSGEISTPVQMSDEDILPAEDNFDQTQGLFENIGKEALEGLAGKGSTAAFTAAEEKTAQAIAEMAVRRLLSKFIV